MQDKELNIPEFIFDKLDNPVWLCPESLIPDEIKAKLTIEGNEDE